eukprot:2029266-Amphidinium_carterae.1
MELLLQSIDLDLLDEYCPNVAFREDEPHVRVVANVGSDNLMNVGGSAVLVLPGFVRHHIPKGTTIATWLAESELDHMAILWEGCMLDPEMTLDNLVPQEIHVFLLHKSSLEVNPPPVIRPHRLCKESQVWSLAEFSFWHAGYNPTFPRASSGASAGYANDEPFEVSRSRHFLEETMARLEYAQRMMKSWRKRKAKHLTHEGGVSDSTVRARLASKAKAAGMVDPATTIQLLWPGHAAALRSTWGNPAVVKSVITSLARKEGIAVDQAEPSRETDDPVYDRDPWANAKAREKPMQKQNTEKFDALTLHSALRLPDGNTLNRLETVDIGAHAAGY